MQTVRGRQAVEEQAPDAGGEVVLAHQLGTDGGGGPARSPGGRVATVMRHHGRVAETAWSSQQCAEAWGVKGPTWLGYVSRGQAPAPLPGDGPKRWDPDAVRTFPRPGAGRSRAAASPEVVSLLEAMAAVTTQIDDLQARQRELAQAGRTAGAEVRAMARALGVSPQTVYGWLDQPPSGR